ncbi:MAG: hypothetical protein HRT70_04400 [Flavobacteriaceae bacterium]|nr:hypothetical protein [Flavobacteriaceae bacterium]
MIGKIFEIEQELYQFKKDAGMHSRKKMPKQTHSTTNYLAPAKTSEIPQKAEPIQELGHREISNHVPYSDSTLTEVYKQEVYAESYTENPSIEARSKSYKALPDGNSQETEISDAFAWDDEDTSSQEGGYAAPFAYEIGEEETTGSSTTSEEPSESHSTAPEVLSQENVEKAEVSEAFGWDAETIESDKDVKASSYGKAYEIEEAHMVPEKQSSNDVSNSFSSTSHPDNGESLNFSIEEVPTQKEDVIDHTSIGMSLTENTANVEDDSQTSTSEAFAWEDLESQTSPVEEKDDFTKDLNAILSGQKQYTPDAQKKPKPAEEKSNSNSPYKAFDQMAASQRYTNTFSLGTIEVQKNMDALDVALAYELSKKGNIPLKKDVTKNR